MLDPVAVTEVALGSAQSIASNPLAFAIAATQIIKKLGVTEKWALMSWSGITGGIAVAGMQYFPDLWVAVVTWGIGLVGTGLISFSSDFVKKFKR